MLLLLLLVGFARLTGGVAGGQAVSFSRWDEEEEEDGREEGMMVEEGKEEGCWRTEYVPVSQIRREPVSREAVSTTWFQRQWMRVSVALRLRRALLGSPGGPYMMAQEALLVGLICRRRS